MLYVNHYRYIDRFSKTKPFAEAEAWLTNFLREHVKDPATVVQGILGVYRGYITGAVGVFQQVEKHMTSGNTDDILRFVSRFLSKYMYLNIFICRRLQD